MGGWHLRITALLAYYLLPGLILACPTESDFSSRKNLAEIYRQLRQARNRCAVESYLAVASRALVAGRLAESLWSATVGLQNKPLTQRQKQELLLLQGHAYHEMGRFEEAITALRKVAFNEQSSDDLAQQAHLLLIKAYFSKAGNHADANVKYLINLFRNRYPKSPYLTGLLSWLQNPI